MCHLHAVRLWLIALKWFTKHVAAAAYLLAAFYAKHSCWSGSFPYLTFFCFRFVFQLLFSFLVSFKLCFVTKSGYVYVTLTSMRWHAFSGTSKYMFRESNAHTHTINWQALICKSEESIEFIYCVEKIVANEAKQLYYESVVKMWHSSDLHFMRIALFNQCFCISHNYIQIMLFPSGFSKSGLKYLNLKFLCTFRYIKGLLKGVFLDMCFSRKNKKHII